MLGVSCLFNACVESRVYDTVLSTKDNRTKVKFMLGQHRDEGQRQRKILLSSLNQRSLLFCRSTVLLH